MTLVTVSDMKQEKRERAAWYFSHGFLRSLLTLKRSSDICTVLYPKLF